MDLTVIHPTKAALQKGVTPLCSEIDLNMYFPSYGKAGDTDTVKELCFTCPVQAECLLWSLHHEDYGIWGGYNMSERAAMRAEQGIPLVAPEVELMARYFSERPEEGLRGDTDPDMPDGWYNFERSEKWKQRTGATRSFIYEFGA